MSLDMPPTAGSSIWAPTRPAGTPAAARGGLAGRLTALARLIQIGAARAGTGEFDLGLLEAAADLLGRAVAPLPLSADDTVLSPAAGPRSRQCSLVNAR